MSSSNPIAIVEIISQGPQGPAGEAGAQGPQGEGSATVAIGTVTTGNAGTNATVTNVGTTTAATLNFTIPRGDTGATGSQGIQGVAGNDGSDGAAATISVGSTTTGNPGTNASVTNSGTSNAATLNFTIPKGDTGATGAAGSDGSDGAAATIAVGTVTTGAAGSSATVTNSGSSNAATFNFTIPKGDTGATGPAGADGAISDGDKGDIVVSNSGSTFTIDNDVVTAAKLADTSVTAGSYTNTNITVDAQGRITSAASGSAGGVTSVTGTTPIISSGGSTPAISISAATTSAAGSMSSADKTKLDGIESNATADQTASEIRTLVEAATDSNVFTDADHTKLNAIEANADVTDTTNVDAAGAVMNSDTTTAGMSFVVDEDNMASNSATKVPTQQSVKAYVDTEVAGVVDSAPSALNTLNELAAALGDDANFSTTVTNSIGTKLPLAGGTMTGNIVMSGTETVDGRDLSVDGAKLDGIDAGAKDDQTAAEIKTLLQSDKLTVNEIADDAITDAKLANSINTAIAANTAKVTNATHTGDVTGATALTIADDAVTYAKMQNVSATDRILGRDSAGAGVIEEITPANLRTMINVEDGATADQTKSDIDALGIAATTAATLATARNIAGVSFDGSADISLNNNAITNGAGYIDGSALNASNLSSGTIPDAVFPSTLPTASAANLTSIPAANITGTLPAIDGSNLTNLPGGLVGSSNEKLFVEAENQMDNSFTTTANFNYVAASPMIVASGATLTVSANSTMTFV